jgi:hypothetical protein
MIIGYALPQICQKYASNKRGGCSEGGINKIENTLAHAVRKFIYYYIAGQLCICIVFFICFNRSPTVAFPTNR